MSYGTLHWKAFQFTVFLGTFISSSVSIFGLLHDPISLPRVIDRFIPHLFSFFFSLMGSNLIGRERGVCALAMMGAGSWGIGIERDWFENWQVG